jgi:hypothetical protein
VGCGIWLLGRGFGNEIGFVTKNNCRNVLTCAHVGDISKPMNEILNKLSALTSEELADIVSRMFNDTAAEAGIILDAALAALEAKMNESDFIRFCERLSA